MRICRGCGGVLGRDCFNEMECLNTSNSEHSALEYRVQVLEQTVFKLIDMLKKHNIDFGEIESVPIKVHYEIDDLPF